VRVSNVRFLILIVKKNHNNDGFYALNYSVENHAEKGNPVKNRGKVP